MLDQDVMICSWFYYWNFGNGLAGSLWFWVLIIYMDLRDFEGLHLKLAWIDWWILMVIRETWVRLWDSMFLEILCLGGHSLMRISTEILKILHLFMDVNPLWNQSEDCHSLQAFVRWCCVLVTILFHTVVYSTSEWFERYGLLGYQMHSLFYILSSRVN